MRWWSLFNEVLCIEKLYREFCVIWSALLISFFKVNRSNYIKWLSANNDWQLIDQSTQILICWFGAHLLLLSILKTYFINNIESHAALYFCGTMKFFSGIFNLTEMDSQAESLRSCGSVAILPIRVKSQARRTCPSSDGPLSFRLCERQLWSTAALRDYY